MDITAIVLEWMINYGAPMVCIILFLSALGTPIPGTIVVIAAGAFIRQELLSIYAIPLFGLLGSVLGDSVIFGVGRLFSDRIERRFGTSNSWINAKESVDKRGGMAIYLSHWLLPLLAVPTNLVAGSSKFPFPKLLFSDAIGRVTWFLIYGGLGYIFGAQWELITDFISNFSGLIGGVLAVVAGIYLLVRYFRNRPEPDQGGPVA